MRSGIGGGFGLRRQAARLAQGMYATDTKKANRQFPVGLRVESFCVIGNGLSVIDSQQLISTRWLVC